MRRNKLFLLAFLLAAAGWAQADSTHIDLELSASHDDNISRAESHPAIKSDNIFGAGLTVTRSMMLSANSGLLLTGGIKLAENVHFSDLSHITADVGAAYRIQPIVGYTAPWIELGGKLEKLVYRDSDIRDGTVFETHASIGSRFTDRIRAQAGLGWDRRWADESRVFELTHRRLFLLGDYKFSGNTTLYANWSRTFGDQAFVAAPEPELRAFAKASAVDPVFSGFNAYRIGAIANIYGLGASIALNPANTLDIGAQHFQIDADGGGAYDGTELRVSWLYRFQ